MLACLISTIPATYTIQVQDNVPGPVGPCVSFPFTIRLGMDNAVTPTVATSQPTCSPVDDGTVTLTYPFVAPTVAQGGGFTHTISPGISYVLTDGTNTYLENGTTGTPPLMQSMGSGVKTFANLAAGTYSARFEQGFPTPVCSSAVVNGIALVNTSPVVITESVPPTAGQIRFWVTGGTEEYTATIWQGVTFIDVIENIPSGVEQVYATTAGAYTLIVTDSRPTVACQETLAVNAPRLEVSIHSFIPEVRMYPNPARDRTRVDYDFVNAENGELEVTDLTGRRLGFWTLKGAQGSIELNLHGWSEGVYVCTVRSNTGMLKTFKLAVTR